MVAKSDKMVLGNQLCQFGTRIWSSEDLLSPLP